MGISPFPGVVFDWSFLQFSTKQRFCRVHRALRFHKAARHSAAHLVCTGLQRLWYHSSGACYSAEVEGMAEKGGSKDNGERASEARDIPMKEGARLHTSSESGNNCNARDGSAEQQCHVMNPAKKKHSEGNIPPPLHGTDVPESPPKFVSLDQIMKASNNLANMFLAHEIAMTDNFQLKHTEYPEESLEKKVKEIVCKAYWDILEQDLKEDPPKYDQALSILEEMKEGLIGILFEHNTRLHAEINEVLDIPLIRQQVEHGALDFERYGRFVISVMARVCAPFRDASVRELLEIKEPVALFRGIMELLQELKLDTTNFIIQQARPHIQAHSVSYEQQKFKEYLEAQSAISPNGDPLRATRSWLKRSFDELCEAKSQHSPDPTNTKSTKGPSFSRVVSRAYMNLLCWDNSWAYPETLTMDRERYLSLAGKVVETTLVSSVLLVTYGTGGAALQGISEFKEDLKCHVQLLLEGSAGCSEDELKEKLKNVAAQVIKEVQECLQKHGYNPMHLSQERMLYDQILDISSPDHPVRKLLRSRILEFIELAVSSSTEHPTKIPPGLSALEKELTDITGSFLRLVSHNRAVFSETYSDIVTQLKEP